MWADHVYEVYLPSQFANQRRLAEWTFDTLSRLSSTTQLGSKLSDSQQRLIDQFHFQMYHDTLTGLPNRAALERRLRRAVEYAACSHTVLAILWIELERPILSGDALLPPPSELLNQTIERVRARMWPDDLLGYVRDHTFALILSNIEHVGEARRFARDLLALLRTPIAHNGDAITPAVTISMGLYAPEQAVACFDPHRAQSALDIHLLPPTVGWREMAHPERQRLRRDLNNVTERNELELLYQPQISAADGQIVGLEALLRWRHPRLGMISPLHFVHLLEETGEIMRVGEWVLREACRQQQIWRRIVERPLTLAVNVSATQISAAGFAQGVLECLASSGMEPAELELELTETTLIPDLPTAINNLTDLRAAGVRVAIDDFGSGHSSLARLQSLPVSCLKIDRSIVQQLDPSQTQNSNTYALVQAIVELAHALRLSIVAEGVETMQDYHTTRALACDRLQGYLFSVPLSADRVSEVLRNRQPLI
jgi:EAL domain-containing protein (putative c-di-GMP-specific phosphodiesterase class I)/GGDEF domain-containing protein